MPYLLSFYVSGAALGPSEASGEPSSLWPGAASSRYLVVNLCLQAAMLACVALPLQLHCSMRPRPPASKAPPGRFHSAWSSGGCGLPPSVRLEEEEEEEEVSASPRVRGRDAPRGAEGDSDGPSGGAPRAASASDG